tara:strand:- start:947 stop:1954 length:1008 start_codon:yes stop_codon:yes gene_type:complete
MKLSICIPTFNRPDLLNNCLNSILISKKEFAKLRFEVCISDNSNNFSSKRIINSYKKKFNLIYSKNKKNVGYIKNYIKVVKMAKGEFVWVIGDDEILKPESFKILNSNFEKNKDIDFMYINSNFLQSKFFSKLQKPFNSYQLPKKMEIFSKIKKNKKVMFFDLINYKVSWDFLLGIFQCIYKREMFLKNLKYIDRKKMFKPGEWSTFENTTFYCETYAIAFKNSKSLIQSKPIIVSTYGHKSWENLWDFIKIVRIPELLEMYKKKGLRTIDYLIMKNFALKDFFPCFINIFKNGKKGGLHYVNFYKHILMNIIYPSIYLNLFKKIFVRIINYEKK